MSGPSAAVRPASECQAAVSAFSRWEGEGPGHPSAVAQSHQAQQAVREGQEVSRPRAAQTGPQEQEVRLEFHQLQAAWPGPAAAW